jgi:hypothetical protein
MIIEIIGGVFVILSGAFLYWFGGHKREKQIDLENENVRLATAARIDGAIRDADADSYDWRSELRDR